MYRSHSIHRTQPAGAPLEALVERPSTSGQAHADAAAGVWPVVPARELSTILTEVDARSIAGNAGTVTLYLSVGPVAQHYVVDVQSAAGESIASITVETRAEALDAYLHPFARPDVPDIFSRVVA